MSVRLNFSEENQIPSKFFRKENKFFEDSLCTLSIVVIYIVLPLSLPWNGSTHAWEWEILLVISDWWEAEYKLRPTSSRPPVPVGCGWVGFFVCISISQSSSCAEKSSFISSQSGVGQDIWASEPAYYFMTTCLVDSSDRWIPRPPTGAGFSACRRILARRRRSSTTHLCPLRVDTLDRGLA